MYNKTPAFGAYLFYTPDDIERYTTIVTQMYSFNLFCGLTIFEQISM